MIYDKIENLSLYFGANENFEAINDFIVKNDLKTIDCGSYEINSCVKVGISEYAPGEGGDYECHRDYHDLQYAITGGEAIDIIPTSCGVDSTGYKPDIEFFKGTACLPSRLALNEGTFAFLAPGDAHKPCIKTQSDTIRKAVFKIKVSK